MGTPIPQAFAKHFKFAEYHHVGKFGLLEHTKGKFGHLLGDNLMQREGFFMETFINVTKDALDPDGKGPVVREMDEELYQDLLLGDGTRKFVTHFVYLVNVGALCCGHAGVWHGGVTSALFDHAFGVLGCTMLKMAATKYINIRFKAPIRVGESVALVVSFDPSNMADEKADRFVAYAEMFNEKGVVVATGESELVDVSQRWAGKN
ncbi:hypothetical protein BgAZ_305050 [Babesia gibsoni]|uniref:Thioesterase domain-containing protein n=1 Tax=Babesia gibsoni TaxID=33632 RepID=A0AAD8LK10_BABGI|nr:hypothetical protein BgAZ_305050 [Babesia gibsoni]